MCLDPLQVDTDGSTGIIESPDASFQCPGWRSILSEFHISENMEYVGILTSFGRLGWVIKDLTALVILSLSNWLERQSGSLVNGMVGKRKQWPLSCQRHT